MEERIRQLPHFKKISDVIWEIPTSYKRGMKVPARIIATEKLLREMEWEVFDQITNVATLPGIVRAAYCMPDGHVGYGYPIGGVAAFDLEEGIISPGGIGFDISCGMRLMRTDLTVKEVLPRLHDLVDTLFGSIPAGVGARSDLRVSPKELEEVMTKGARWAVEKGYGRREDLENIEEKGEISGADPEAVSQHARERGISQLGTLGSGNHYLEIQKVEKIFDQPTAQEMGVTGVDQIVVMIHTGSRGFGHQIGTDYLRIFEGAMAKYKISVPDRQLACAPFKSKEGQDYFGAMTAAANLAFANRQIIMQQVRNVFEKIFDRGEESLGLDLIYDVAHNIAKIEEYEGKKLVVHRKGATRSFPGQPVIIGGSMESGSYLLMGTEKAIRETFASTAHGSGRTMSRAKAKRQVRGDTLQKEMEERGIYVRTVSFAGLAEEAGVAYKNISEVVETLDRAGISKKVASFVPIGNIKG
ncbi:RtcB family protein [Candidatus Gottesmanbacteria bacterium]|nr:RtcB family protein [Candidatus Gottesmanbacteria bacterium]